MPRLQRARPKHDGSVEQGTRLVLCSMLLAVVSPCLCAAGFRVSWAAVHVCWHLQRCQVVAFRLFSMSCSTCSKERTSLREQMQPDASGCPSLKHPGKIH